MIRYSLKCREGHQFDGWFQGSDAFDRQVEDGHVACAVCGSTAVEKALMAPSVPAKGERPRLEPATAREKALATLRRKIEANSDYVGRDFAAEARRIHVGEAEQRAIWGEASGEEAKSLLDEGVPVLPIPWFSRRDD